MCLRGAGHAAADGAGAVPAGEAQDAATSDKTSTAIMGDALKALAERNQEYKFYHDLHLYSRKHERIGRRLSHAILYVRVPPGR
jgi:phosphoribosylaminoimidazole carboxylase (NCAIR synthetase)